MALKTYNPVTSAQRQLKVVTEHVDSSCDFHDCGRSRHRRQRRLCLRKHQTRKFPHLKRRILPTPGSPTESAKSLTLHRPPSFSPLKHRGNPFCPCFSA